MRTIAEKRKDYLKDLETFLDFLDPSGENSDLYHKFFSVMTDEQFDQYMIKFFNDPKANLYLEIVEFERDLKIENLEKCAKKFGIPLFEKVAVPYITGDADNAPVTPEPVAVGYIHIKRMQQTLLKKNSGSIDIRKRDPRTGQVTNEDKNARNSDVESYSLVAIGAEAALREFMGPRADDQRAKNEMYNSISKNGYVTLASLSNDPENKVALNSIDVYFRMGGINTNLVVPLDLIPEPRK